MFLVACTRLCKSLCRSVGWSPHLLFFRRFWYSSWKTSITAPTQQHATGFAVYPSLLRRYVSISIVARAYRIRAIPNYVFTYKLALWRIESAQYLFTQSFILDMRLTSHRFFGFDRSKWNSWIWQISVDTSLFITNDWTNAQFPQHGFPTAKLIRQWFIKIDPSNESVRKVTW